MAIQCHKLIKYLQQQYRQVQVDMAILLHRHLLQYLDKLNLKHLKYIKNSYINNNGKLIKHIYDNGRLIQEWLLHPHHLQGMCRLPLLLLLQLSLPGYPRRRFPRIDDCPNFEGEISFEMAKIDAFEEIENKRYNHQ